MEKFLLKMKTMGHVLQLRFQVIVLFIHGVHIKLKDGQFINLKSLGNKQR